LLALFQSNVHACHFFFFFHLFTFFVGPWGIFLEGLLFFLNEGPAFPCLSRFYVIHILL